MFSISPCFQSLKTRSIPAEANSLLSAMPKTILFGLSGLLLAEPPRGGTVYGDSESIPHGEGLDFRSLLKDVGESCSDAFAELGAGALTDLKGRVYSVEIFPLFDGETGSIVKMAAYAKSMSNASEFCGYYARWLGKPLTERSKHEIYEILEEAIDLWRRQEVFDKVEG